MQKRWNILSADEDKLRSLQQALNVHPVLCKILVRRGMEFRKSHEVIGRIVVYAMEQGKELHELSLEECQQFSPLFEQDLFAAISLENCLAGKTEIGGTAPEQVKQELARARESLFDY